MFNSKAVPTSVHQLIDKEQNCEDIALNVMIGRHLARVDRPQCSGIFVQPRDVRNLEKDASKHRNITLLLLDRNVGILPSVKSLLYTVGFDDTTKRK